MELPTEDLELVHALQVAPRATWTELAGVLGRHPSTLAARWERLHADGYTWVTAHAGTVGVDGCAAFIGVECLPGHREEVLHRLCTMPSIATVEESARDWDLRLTALARSWQEMSREVLSAVRLDPGVARVRMNVVTRLFVTGNHLRLDVLSAHQLRSLKSLRSRATQQVGSAPPAMDALLRVLQHDGRATSAQIAAATGSHPTTATRHLHRAIDSGLVHLRCELAQEFSGYPVACQWYVRVAPDQLQTAVDYLRGFRTLRLCAATTGDTNLTFLLWLRSPEAVLGVESGLQAAAPSAQVVESDVGVRTHKRMGWLLREDSRATGQVVT